MKKEWLLIIPSILLFLCAPDYYDWTFCLVCCLVFLVGAVMTLIPEIKKGNFISFNMIFFFSYFWTSFAYPVLVYGTQTDRGNIINKALNWDLLSHTSALALLFITSYMIGYSYYNKNVRTREIRMPHHKVPYFFYTICLVAYLGMAVLGYLMSGHVNMSVGQFMIDIFFTVYAICLYVNVNNNKNKYLSHTFKAFITSNKYLIITGALVFVAFIVIGDRMPAIKIILMVIAVYYFFWNKVKIRHLLAIGFCLLLMLFFVRQTRGSDTNLASGNISMSTVGRVFSLENGALYVFADLFLINRELCLGYDYSMTHELYHPERIIIAPLSPVPLLPSAVSRVFWGITPSEMETGSRLNSLLGDDFNIEGHLGNHPASDLLMSFGVVGLILIAYILGRSVSYIQARSRTNFYAGICLIVLMGWSVYLARSVTLALIRPIGYVYLFGYLIYHIPYGKKN